VSEAYGSTTSRAPVLRWAGPVLLAMVGVVLLTEGVGEPGLRDAVRWTARTSLLLFCLGFASWGLPRTAWPARHRPGLLAALALSHGLHLLGIAALALATAGANLAGSPPARLLGGMLAYALIFLGAWRPESAAVRWGSLWIFTVFLISYLPRAMAAPAIFGPAVGLLGVALAVRLAGTLRQSRAETGLDLP
jgi:hypothetical protein